jgi:hypothetical protein
MAKIEIVRKLFEQIQKKFKGESHQILDLLETTASNPKKGKAVGQVGNIVIKELKYKGFRFYFITNAHKIKFFSKEELIEELLLFVRMSNKKEQAKVIQEIKEVLLKIGKEGFYNQ